MARRIEGIPLPQWLGLDPWEFVNPVSYWIERGYNHDYLKLIYRTSAERLVALHLEEPAQEDMDIQ